MSKLVINALSERHHAQIAARLQEAVRADLAVSYIQQSGVRALRAHIDRLCNEGQGVRLICSFDLGITDPEAVGELKRLGVEARIYETPRGSFHPKVWLFGNADGGWCSLVGSANFTAGAMFDNVEAGVLSENGEVSRQAREFFERMWSDAHPVSDADLRRWAENRRRREEVARRVAQVDEQRNEAESASVLEEFIRGWIDIGVGESVAGAGQVIGKQWRGWYIIPDQGEINDELMARIASICRVIKEKAGGSLDISKRASTQAGAPLGEVLKITAAKFKRSQRKMSDRDLFIRQEKNYLVHLGLATAPTKDDLVLSRHGMELAADSADAKSVYTDAMDNYVYNGLGLLAFTRRLLTQVKRLSFEEFSFFACHVWTMEEVDAVAAMIRMYRRLPEATRRKFVGKANAYFEEKLGPTAKGVKMNYDKKARHTMSALGWCAGLFYNADSKELGVAKAAE